MKKVFVVFKTHLDIGFTDFSANVVKKYMDEFIPSAVRVAKELRERGGDARLRWTTGSWLIHEYLRTHQGASGDDVRRAIENGDIRWHGLPFTTHTELMGADLFKYGLSLSQSLDERFGVKTIAAKMTDVPGHTKAIIPLMKSAGVEFLHIGVNRASSVPEVPPIFRWKADSGEMLNVMYQGRYGEFTQIGDTDYYLCFAHTGDNLGVQSADAIEELFDKLHSDMPDAEIVAADLNDIALAVREIEGSLPIITDEIGDSWIHGVGTDPKKVAQFRALQRLCCELPDGDDKDTLLRALIMIPEHTWGLNMHYSLGDHEHYDRDSFSEMRKNAYNFKRSEASWAEQRAYLTDAVDALSEENKAKAMNCLNEAVRENIGRKYFWEAPLDKEFTVGNFTLKFNKQGEIVHLVCGEKVISDKKHRLLSLVYEQFCADDYKRFFTQYNRCDEVWANEDFTKPGIETGSSCYMRFEPQKASVYPLDSSVLVRYSFPEIAHKKLGCPLMFDVLITAEDNKLKFDLAWFCKPANRVAEAIWIGFRPIAENKRISKLGQLIDPKYVVRNGQCRLHATDLGVKYDGLSIESLDCALVAPSEPSLLNFTNIKPEDTDAVYFNLYNNVWGTNFPMWYDEDARFRFILNLD